MFFISPHPFLVTLMEMCTFATQSSAGRRIGRPGNAGPGPCAGAGRPPGSRNKVTGELALARLMQIMESKSASAIARVKAAKIILDLAMLGLDE